LRLTKLELNGFKSFARKTELQFDSGITAIIGPNGSGKSNIADAVRWVLGEQSARALRGTRMEDVIFNGTQNRKAQAYCEVILTFDNSDHSLPVDYTEVAIMRRVYRSGESEYAINRNHCRLKDINELFRDTGVGKDGYSIIGQGKVEEILSGKSEDRRQALEEAAGVMRYRVRKEEAERKLERTKDNLVRLGDILEELSKQLEPLQEQSETAQAFLRLREELKDLEINLFLVQYKRQVERKKNMEETLAQLQNQLQTDETTENGLLQQCQEMETKLSLLESTSAQAQNSLMEELSAIDMQVGESNVLQERLENMDKEIFRLQEQLQMGQARESELCDQLKRMEDSDRSGLDVRQKLAAQMEEQQQTLACREREITAREEELESQKNQIMEAMNRLADAKSAISRYEAMQASFVQRNEAIQKNWEDLQQQAQDLHAELEEEQAKFQEKTTAYNELLQQKQQNQLQQKAAAGQIVAERTAVQELSKQISAQQSRCRVLEEMSRQHEGYYSSVRNVLRDSQRDFQLKKSIIGVVAELFHAPKEYEVALEAVLGATLQNIVTPTPEDAKIVIDYLHKRQYGRATFLPVSSMQPKSLTQQERDLVRMRGYIGVASELITFDPGYANIMENLLGRTILVEDLDAGVAINKKLRSSLRIATLRGDIINPGGAMTGGSTAKREFSLLGRERELQELRLQLQELMSRQEQAQQRLDRAQQNAQKAQQAFSSMEDALHEEAIELAQGKERLDMIRRDRDNNAAQIARLEEEATQVADHMNEIAQSMQHALQAQSGIEQDSTTARQKLAVAQKELYALRNARETIASELTELKVRQMALEKENDAATAEKNRLFGELEKVRALMDDNALRLKETHVSMDEIREQRGQMKQQIEAQRAAAEEKREQQRTLEEERLHYAQVLAQLRARREGLVQDVRSGAEQIHRQEMNLSKLQTDMDNNCDRIWEEYGVTYETALPYSREIAATSANIRVDTLKKDIRALGNVNVNAIEDYKNVKERYTALKEQVDDLTKAEEDLQTLIVELTETMKKEFLDKFHMVQENFSQVFTQLFGGGSAEIRLENEFDALNCDIIITAQPPGKKLQMMSLLSGGERSLTAIALLFAMLRLKPTAFCILDEIESALDEANTVRFANFLRNYAQNTQFIMITHHKASMEACDALYGIAMEEKGVSKVVSARFHEAV